MCFWPKILLLAACAVSPAALWAAIANDQASAIALIKAANPSLFTGDKNNKNYLAAAIAYADALPWYESQNDTSNVRQLQAAIYWCRYKTTNATIDSFQAENLLAPDVLNTLDRVNLFFITPVVANSEKDYTNFAQSFIEKNPRHAFMGALLYFEISQRFLAQPETDQAKQRMEQLFARHDRMLSKNIISKNDLIFELAPAEATASPITRASVPSESTLKISIEAIHELYKSDYASIKGRAGLVVKLMRQAQQEENDLSSVYALLFEARELSISSKDTFKVLEICDLIANQFEIVDSIADKKSALSKIRGQSIVTSLIKLLDDTDDPGANLSVGMWYAKELQEWELAIPHLAKGSDAAYAEAAKAELAQKSDTADFIAVADTWYEMGKRNSTIKESFWRHALSLYENVRPQVNGLQAAVVDKRIVELTAYLPIGPNTNFDKLTVGQWEKIKAPIIIVDASQGRTQTGIVLRDGQQIRVVPHPTDTWHITALRRPTIDTTYKGQSMRKNGSVGELTCKVGEGEEQQSGIVTGIGEITLFPMLSGVRRPKASGTIRVKIMPVSK